MENQLPRIESWPNKRACDAFVAKIGRGAAIFHVAHGSKGGRPGASGEGRAYLVEIGLEQDGYAALRALVAEYLNDADRHQRIPMTRGILAAPASGCDS